MENKETILQLYENFIDEIYTMTHSNLEVTKKIDEQETLLRETLTEEQKEIIETLNNYEDERNEIVNKNTFIYAFSLATKLFVEGKEMAEYLKIDTKKSIHKI